MSISTTDTQPDAQQGILSRTVAFLTSLKGTWVEMIWLFVLWLMYLAIGAVQVDPIYGRF